METTEIKNMAESLIGKTLWCITTVKKPNGTVAKMDCPEYMIKEVKLWNRVLWAVCGEKVYHERIFDLKQLQLLANGHMAKGFFSCGDGTTSDGKKVKTRCYIKN